MKKILVPLTGRPPDRRAVATAFLVADRFRGHVDGLCVMPHVDVRASAEGPALPTALADQLVRIGMEDQARIVGAARQLFEDFCIRYGATVAQDPGTPDANHLSASWQEATGSLADILVEEARLADLTVFAQPLDAAGAAGPAIEAVVFGSGRQLLLASASEPLSIGSTAAIAWDGGSAAARAVMSAMPFLRQADKVVILFADNPDSSRSADPGRLAGYLACHGIPAATQRVSAAGRPSKLSTALIRSAVELGGDLLVMGAYGHSRVREMVLGGVTHDILRDPPGLPILMAH